MSPYYATCAFALREDFAHVVAEQYAHQMNLSSLIVYDEVSQNLTMGLQSCTHMYR